MDTIPASGSVPRKPAGHLMASDRISRLFKPNTRWTVHMRNLFDEDGFPLSRQPLNLCFSKTNRAGIPNRKKIKSYMRCFLHYAEFEVEPRARVEMEHTDETEVSRVDERNVFIFLAVFLAPILAVAIVGGYGFLIWMSQLIYGPPGPPGG